MTDGFWQMWPQLKGQALWAVVGILLVFIVYLSLKHFVLGGNRRAAVVEKRNADAISVLQQSVADLKKQREIDARQIEALRAAVERERRARVAQEKRLQLVEAAYGEVHRRLPEIAGIIERRMAILKISDDVISFLCEELKRIRPLDELVDEEK